MRSSECRPFAHRCALILVSVFLTGVGGSLAAPLKVDISNSGRPLTEGLDPAFTDWATTQNWFPGGNTTSRTFGGVTVTFSRVGSVGTGLKTGYWKEGVQSTIFNVKLTGDGLRVDTPDAAAEALGSQIEMRIAGLSPGIHSLLLYLNSWDGPASVAPLDILVNGTQVIKNLPVSVRVTDNNNASTAYLNLTAVAGQDVVVLVKADTGGAELSKNVHINGFEIDNPNVLAQANNPVPDNADEHVDVDTGALTLGWGTATLGAASHHVYFGTNSTAVEDATTASPEFRGNQTVNTYPVSGINPHLTYYWRVDEVGAGGAVTKGSVWYFRPRHLAFPGAEGHGRFARGGRGGKVVHVNSLADYNTNETPIPGTLRYAVTAETGPRVIVFDVSGLITLKSRLTLNSPYVTIAGQTAPGKGICLKQWTMGLSGANDAIVRFIRSRPGRTLQTITVTEYKNGTEGPPTTAEAAVAVDGMGMQGSSHSILDHCSISWTIDEAFSSRSAKNITLQNTLISEALNKAKHPNYIFIDDLAGTEHGYAASVGGDIGSFHHNLLAHCYGRNWSMAGGLDGSNTYAGRLDFTNNVVYNWGSRTTDGGAKEVDFVGNYYKPGAGTSLVPYALTVNHEDNFAGSQRCYFSGNVMPGHFDETNQTVGRRSMVSVSPAPTYETFVNAPFFPSYVTTQTARGAYKRVLSDVGCNLPLLDDHDVRIIRETRDGTYTYSGSRTGKRGFPDVETDVGGWEDYGNEIRPSGWDTDNDGMPNWWESIKEFNTHSPVGDFSEANADPDGDGYTNLEDYLNWMGAPRFECNSQAVVEVDLPALSSGYSVSPGYTFSGSVNGTVTLISGNKARFVPTPTTNALGGFTYTVTDSAMDSMTRTVGIRIIAADPIPVVSLAATDANAGEFGVDQSLSFTITRTGATTTALSVPLVASGTSTLGSDYSGFVGNVTIPAGQSGVALSLIVLPDDLSEGPETVIISLGTSASFTGGLPASTTACIADSPSQGYFFAAIADPAKRGSNDDADGDSNVNAIEYFMGSHPGDSASRGALEIPFTGSDSFKVCYPRAKSRSDVTGSLRWSPDLANWFISGQSDGTRTVTFTETVVSDPVADPETVEATATIIGSGGVPKIFVRLGVR